MKLLRDLCLISSKSKSEKPVVEFIVNFVKTIPDTTVTVDEHDNVYVTRGKSNTYPCVVAHTDTVFDNSKVDVKFVRVDDFYFGYDPAAKKTVGVGFDDKTGIYVALKMLQAFNVFKCAFFVSEEIGCLGSAAADLTFFDDCRFVLQCDRRGNSDLITTASSTKITSDDFLKAINPGDWGYTSTHGLMTDVYKLRSRGLKIASCNISCGYYNPHTSDEAQSISDLEKCMRFVEHIIRDCQDVYPFPVEVYKPPKTYSYYDSYSQNPGQIIPSKYKYGGWGKQTLVDTAAKYFEAFYPWVKPKELADRLPKYCHTLYKEEEIKEVFDDFQNEYVTRFGFYGDNYDYWEHNF